MLWSEMARPLRINVAGGWYHVTSRGNERREIFRGDADRQRFLQSLARMTDRFAIRLHAYVLMANHYHLLVETVQADLSRALQWLNSSYSQYFNRRHRRSGHLLQGRFQAILVESERWGLELSRYVHLNPIRVKRYQLEKAARQRHRRGAGPAAPLGALPSRLAQLRSYRWSSYRAYIGWEARPGWLVCETTLGRLGGPIQQQPGLYRQYVEKAMREGLWSSPWEQLQGQLVLGSREFVEGLQDVLEGDVREQASLGQLQVRPGFEEVIGVVEQLKGERWDSFVNRYGDWGRDVALYLGQKHCGLKLKELGAAAGGIDYATVSAAIKQLELRSGRDRELADLIQKAQQELLNPKI